MAWFLLILAGACEMIWPVGFKYTNGFRTNIPMIALTMILMITSFGLLSQATGKGIHVGTAYAVWTGIGAAGTAIVGMILFNEPRDFVRLSCLGLIILGVLGLKFLSPPETTSSAPTAAAPAATTGESTRTAG
jgi:quaternary ammonium compound-resistance protein SugE